MSESEPSFSWKPVLELAAAAAGLFLLIELAGGAIMWARLQALGLPAARGVSLMSPQYLLAVGTHSLLLPLALGLLSIVLLHVIAKALPRDLEHWASSIVVVALVATLLPAAAVLQLSSEQFALALGVGLGVGVPFVVIAHRMTNLRRVGIGLMLLTAFTGGAIEFIKSQEPPARLEQVFLFLRDGKVTSGAYIAETSSDVFLAPDSFDRTYGQIVSIPRAAIVRLAFSSPRDFTGAGVADPRALLGGGRRDANEQPKSTADIQRYFARWAADTVWRYPPISFLESESFLTRHNDEYFAPVEQPWSDAGVHVELPKLVSDAHGYSGKPLITHGKLRQVVSVVIPRTRRVRTRFLTLMSARARGPRAICAVNTRSSRRFPEGRDVEIRGVVVAVGSFAVTPGGQVEGAFLQCSAARLRSGR